MRSRQHNRQPRKARQNSQKQKELAGQPRTNVDDMLKRPVNFLKVGLG
jgi:hypothetical protein